MEHISCYKNDQPPENTRWLIAHNLENLVTMAIHEATLFQNTNRTKSMALDQLKHTLLIAQDKIMKHTETVLKTLVKISHTTDEIPEAQQKIKHIVQIIGYFVAPSYYTSILSQEQFKNSQKNTIALLKILAQMITATNEFDEHANLFLIVLTHYEQVFYENDEGMVVIFQIVSTLLEKLKDISPKILHIIFQITINVQATDLSLRRTESKLRECLKYWLKRFHAAEIGPILESMIKNKQYTQWNKTSKNRFKFDTIVRNCSSASRFLQDILIVFEFMLNPQSDIELRMDTLVLTECILGVSDLKQALAPLAEQLLKKLLLLAVQWKVGKPHIKIRKAEVINIKVLIQKGIINEEQLLDCFKDLIPHIKNCLNDDWAPQLRLASCELLQKYLLGTKESIGDDQLKEHYPILIQRLDDSQNPIRLKVTSAINNSEDIRTAIFVNLRHAAVVNPKLVQKQAKQNLQRMMNKDLCKELIEYCDERIEEMEA